MKKIKLELLIPYIELYLNILEFFLIVTAQQLLQRNRIEYYQNQKQIFKKKKWYSKNIFFPSNDNIKTRPEIKI